MGPTPTQHKLTRRLRRHVIGPNHNFFVVTTPGLEAVCLSELETLQIGRAPSLAGRGLIHFNGRLTDLYQANLHLTTANRIFMQVGAFSAPNLGALRDKAMRFPWELHLNVETKVTLRVRTSQTPLYHSGAIAEIVTDAITFRQTRHCVSAQTAPDHIPPQMILVHMQDVICSIFIDSSGELLYKRGLKTHGGRAPLRETVAASMLRLCDFRPHDAVLDPMCGSGTFALEAAMRAADIAPGWFRTFAFESWPAFRPATWQYIRRQADWDSNILVGLKVYAFDNDQRIVDRLQQTLSKSPLGPAIKVRQADFFTLTPRRISPRPGVALINPPYGKRLRDKSSSKSFYQRLGQKMAADFNGWRLGLVVPEKKLLGSLPFSGALHSFRHGGDRRWILVVRL